MPLTLLLLLGCADPPATPSTCSVDVAAGGVDAVIDGAAWSSTASWIAAGSSVQVNAPAVDGWWFSMVLQDAVDGTAAGDVVAAASFPAEFDLGGDGGWVVLYPDAGDSYSSRNGGGTLTLVDDAGGLAACFSFDAAQDGGAAVSVTDGQLVATASSVR